MTEEEPRAPDARALSAFRERFSGDVILPPDEGYDEARRVWNAMIGRRPAMIVRPRQARDVASAIRFAHDEGLLIAVRGGGHSLPGLSTCDDSVVIDLSRIRGSGDDARLGWARAAYALVEPESRTGRYVNDVGDSGPDLGRWVYGDAKYDRLVTVKRAWDPDNVFRLNQNIKP